MKLKTEIDGVQFFISIEIDDHFKPPWGKDKLNQEDLVDLKNRKIAFYSLIIESECDGDKAIHYFPGKLLTSNEQKLYAEVETLLIDLELLEDILDYWELRLSPDGPEWKE